MLGKITLTSENLELLTVEPVTLCKAVVEMRLIQRLYRKPIWAKEETIVCKMQLTLSMLISSLERPI